MQIKYTPIEEYISKPMKTHAQIEKYLKILSSGRMRGKEKEISTIGKFKIKGGGRPYWGEKFGK